MRMEKGTVSDDDTEGFCKIEQFEGEATGWNVVEEKEG